MKKNIIRIGILFVFIMLILSINIYAYLVDEQGLIDGKGNKNDNSYAFKATSQDAENSSTTTDLSINIKKTYENLAGRNYSVIISPKSNSHLYQSDFVNLSFTVVGDFDDNYSITDENNDFEIKTDNKDIRRVHKGNGSDGSISTHSIFRIKMQLKNKSGTLKINLKKTTLGMVSELENITIYITNVESIGAKASKLLQDQHILKYPYSTERNDNKSRMRKIIENMGFVSDSDLNNADFSLEKKDNLNGDIKFSDYNYTEYYYKDSLAFKFTAKTSRTTSSYDDTKKEFNDNFFIQKNKKYVVLYKFHYFGDIKDLLYSMSYSELVVKDGETEDEAFRRIADELGSGLDSQSKEASSAIGSKFRLSTKSKHEDRATVVYNDVLDDVNSYTDVGDIDSKDAETVETTVGKILAIITNIGIVISVIMPAVLGVKYMLGSLEERAEYKKDMIPYFVGAILLFSICTVVKILQSIGNSINNP